MNDTLYYRMRFFFNENVCADVVFITEIIVVVVCGHRLYYNMDTLLSLIIYLFCVVVVSLAFGRATNQKMKHG